MKKTMFVMAMAIFIALVPSMAQDKSVKKVEASVERLRNAMVNADSVEMKKLTIPDLSYGHSGGHVEAQAEFISKITSGKSDFVSIDLTEQTISINKNVAVVRHILFAKTNDNGKPGEVKLRVLLIWQKLHGTWKLVARQAVKMT